MTTSRVSEEVKERSRDLKRDDDSSRDLLDRLGRSETAVERIAESPPPVDDDTPKVENARDRPNESLERRRR